MASLAMRHLCPGWTDPRFIPHWAVERMYRMLNRVSAVSAIRRQDLQRQFSEHLETFMDRADSDSPFNDMGLFRPS